MCVKLLIFCILLQCAFAEPLKRPRRCYSSHRRRPDKRPWNRPDYSTQRPQDPQPDFPGQFSNYPPAYPGQQYPNQGYPNQGYYSQYPNQGYPPRYPNQGYPPGQYPNQGYPNQGFPPQSIPEQQRPTEPGSLIPLQPQGGAIQNPGVNPSNQGVIPNQGVNPNPGVIPNQNGNPNQGVIPNQGINPVPQNIGQQIPANPPDSVVPIQPGPVNEQVPQNVPIAR